MKAEVKKIKGKYYAVLPTKEVLEIKKTKAKVTEGDIITGKIVSVKRLYWFDISAYYKSVRIFKLKK